MAASIRRGYLIYRLDFDAFDEILVFIDETGRRFSLFGAGVRRITSKNARALIFGNFLEIEAFLSLSENKMGRLKKVISLSEINFELTNNKALYWLNDLLNKVNVFNIRYYHLYQEVLSLILLRNNENAIGCYLFIKFLKINKFHLNLTECVLCQNKKQIVSLSLKHHGLICKNCLSQDDVYFTSEELLIFLKIYQNLGFYEPQPHEYLVFENLYKKLYRLYLKSKKEIFF